MEINQMNAEANTENSIILNDDREKILSKTPEYQDVEDKPKHGKKIALLLTLGLLAGIHYGNENAKANIQQSIQESQLVSNLNHDTINSILQDIRYENISAASVSSLESKINNISDVKVSDAELILISKKFALYLSNFIMTGVQPAQPLDGAKVKNLFLAYLKLSTTVEGMLKKRDGEFQDLFLLTDNKNSDLIDKEFSISKALSDSFLKENSYIITENYQILKSKDNQHLVSNLDNLLDLIIQNQFLYYFVEQHDRLVDAIHLNSIIYQELSKTNKQIFENFWGTTEEEKTKIWTQEYQKKMKNANLNYLEIVPTWFEKSNFVFEKTKLYNSEKISAIKVTGKEDTSFYARALSTYLKVYRISDFEISTANFSNSLNNNRIEVKKSPQELDRELAELQFEVHKFEMETRRKFGRKIPELPELNSSSNK